MLPNPFRVRIENVRASFANDSVHTPKDFNGNGVFKHSCTFLFKADHPAVEEIERVSIAAAKNSWADKARANYKQLKAQDRLLIHDGDGKANYAGFEGNLYINASNPKAPVVYDRSRKVIGIESGLPYSGCYVDAIVDLWVQDNKYGKRINAELKAIRFVQDGERLSTGGGATVSADEFEPLPGEDNSEDDVGDIFGDAPPSTDTASADDIPF